MIVVVTVSNAVAVTIVAVSVSNVVVIAQSAVNVVHVHRKAQLPVTNCMLVMNMA
jgi:hypothetical protein